MNWQKGVIRRYSKKQPLFRDIEENYVTLKNHISLFLVKQKLLELFLEPENGCYFHFICNTYLSAAASFRQ